MSTEQTQTNQCSKQQARKCKQKEKDNSIESHVSLQQMKNEQACTNSSNSQSNLHNLSFQGETPKQKSGET